MVQGAHHAGKARMRVVRKRNKKSDENENGQVKVAIGFHGDGNDAMARAEANLPLTRDFPFDLMFTVFKWLFPAFS
jgi:hypothetical protein